MVDNSKNMVTKNALKIVGLITNISSVSREGNSFGKTMLPAKVIFDKMNCNEIDFVKALIVVKENFKPSYNRIEIPKCWDGCSHLFFPEAYQDDTKIFCKVNCNGLTANEFFDLPSDEIRKWKFGECVYLPFDHQKTIECLSNKKLLLLDD